MAISSTMQQEVKTGPQTAALSAAKDGQNFCMECTYAEECIECGPGRRYTMCQIRQHNTIDSAWLVVGDKIYDATEYMMKHPGGESSILKKAGGVSDCTEDFNFHSKSGRKVWQKYYVGRVKPCPNTVNNREWWQFWM